MTFPFKDSNGGTVTAGVQTFTMNSDGSVNAAGNITLPKAGLELLGATLTSCAGSGGFGFTKASGASPQFTAAFPPLTATIAIPGIDTVDPEPLTLNIPNLTVSTEGGVSFSNATLTPGTPLKITLPAPFNAELTVSSASASMKDGQLQALNLVNSLTLPNSFSAVDTSTGASPVPVTIPNVQIGFQANGVPSFFVGNLAQNLNIFFNGFEFTIPTTAQPPFILDLSKTSGNETDMRGKPYPASWEGIFIGAATVKLPSSFSIGGGESFSVTRFSIGSTGLSGEISWTAGQQGGPTLKLPGFSSTLKSFDITFLNNQVIAGGGSGVINCPDWGISVNAAISFSSSGLVTISASTNNPIPIPSLGVSLQIDQGTVTYDNSGNGTLTLTGSISFGDNPPGGFQSLQDASFAVSGLSINSQGHVSFTSAWLDLPNAQPITVGPLTATISQIGVGQNGNNGPLLDRIYRRCRVPGTARERPTRI